MGHIQRSGRHFEGCVDVIGSIPNVWYFISGVFVGTWVIVSTAIKLIIASFKRKRRGDITDGSLKISRDEKYGNMAIESAGNIDHNDPNNPFWVIYTINLEVVDLYAQTFETEEGARTYVDELRSGKTLKTLLSNQIHLCTKEQANAVIDNIDMLDGVTGFVDHLAEEEKSCSTE